MAFKMKYKILEGGGGELRNAVKAHGKQADTIEKHIDKMKDSPMKKSGTNVSWKYGGKTYHGTLIPSKETSTHRYARTHNGKIKSLPKNK